MCNSNYSYVYNCYNFDSFRTIGFSVVYTIVNYGIYLYIGFDNCYYNCQNMKVVVAIVLAIAITIDKLNIILALDITNVSTIVKI